MQKLKSVKITQKEETKDIKLDGITYKNAVKYDITETIDNYYEDKDVNNSYSRYVVNDNGTWKVFREKGNIKESTCNAIDTLASMYLDGKGEKQDSNQAATILNDAIKKYPKYSPFYYSLARTYIFLERYDESIENINIYLNDNKIKNEDKSDAYNVLGVAYESEEDYTNAINSYQKAIDLNANNQYAKTNLERVSNY